MALSARNYSIHVLLVDHESKRLDDIGNMIRMCKDTVTAVESVADAITKLVEPNERFDLVLANINSPNSNSHFIGFRLIQRAIDMAIPVILMSSDDNNDRSMVASAIEMGVTLYLQKPVTIEVVSCLWQYVLKEKVVKDSEKTDIGGSVGIVDMKESGNDDKGKSVKRGRVEGRLQWTPELHNDFLAAIKQLGGTGCTPMEILKLMNHPTLTREQVASHLQKYRTGKWVLPVAGKSTSLSILPVDTKSTSLSILQAPSHTEDSSGQPPKRRELTPPTSAPHLKIEPVDYSSSNPPLQLEEVVKEEEESTLLQNIQPGDSNPSNPPLQLEEAVKEEEEESTLLQNIQPGDSNPSNPPLQLEEVVKEAVYIQPGDSNPSNPPLQSEESDWVVKEAEESPLLTSPGMTELSPSKQQFDMDSNWIDYYYLPGVFDLSSGLGFHNELREEKVC